MAATKPKRRTGGKSKRRPWGLRMRGDGLQVRFSHEGHRYEHCTGTTDSKVAERVAAEYYADVLAGRIGPPARATGRASDPLKPAASEWLADIEGRHTEVVWNGYAAYVKKHFAPFFKTLGGLTPARLESYGSYRLRNAKRATVQRELGALRGMVRWFAKNGYLASEPEVATLPKGALGTAYKIRRRGEATEIEEDEAEAIIAKLPEWSASKKVPPFPVRARAIVAAETGLRPSTLSQLRVPEHYQPGAGELKIKDETDKNRWGRGLPLSERAQAALDSVCPPEGVIFGKHDMRDQLRTAAKDILDDYRRMRFCEYDLKHLRATLWAETGQLAATAYLMGWKKVSTVDVYAKPNKRAAERLLKSTAEAREESTAEETPAPQPGSQAWVTDDLCGMAEAVLIADSARKTECEGEDSNLHGSYPTATSRGL
jgi:integrase